MYWYTQLAVVRVRHVYVSDSRLKESVTLVQISDFHNNVLALRRPLLKKLKAMAPDAVVFTGDCINRHTTDPGAFEALALAFEGVPRFYVSGNHEVENRVVDMARLCRKCHIIDLAGKTASVKGVTLYGESFAGRQFQDIGGGYAVLLVHNPYQFIKAPRDYDVVLSGHTHGGQVRLPWLGQIIDHGPTLFPKYSKGWYQVGKSKLYIDSGAGQHLYFRLWNPVQVTVVHLTGEV
ncbi:metallophosphoesterase family protein [Peptoniphilus equinus]|uniref:Metallophosphoesterase family protein n=1 Tax=Peptoniphilus equinus TaxID=3016343 RepID=A0ABY7QUE4_9FIRM|nr:metallophosphoesterase [Peptoniphilus equinus]WBW50402.1 metallophosphoesterase family protein [Peptoniphilus equinus]